MHNILFQSTPPVKAATCTHGINTIMLKFQSTPPVKAATSSRSCGLAASDISIHAAREGGDTTATGCEVQNMIFQSTPPVKAATENPQNTYTPTEFQSTPPVKAAT